MHIFVTKFCNMKTIFEKLFLTELSHLLNIWQHTKYCYKFSYQKFPITCVTKYAIVNLHNFVNRMQNILQRNLTTG